MNIIEAVQDKHLFKPWFKDEETWQAWFAFLHTLFALPMNREHKAIYERCTRRSAVLSEPFSEAWLVVGRRGGKSFIVALIGVFLACFCDYSKYLQAGERGHVMILATDRKQGRVIFRYIKALLEGVPMLNKMIESVGRESIDLNNDISIEIHTASYRAVRGYTVVAAVLDEIAFWRSDESANPDREILDALRPAMSTIPNAMLMAISSPYAKRGALYETYQSHFGKGSDVLVWQADTRTMNPTVPQSFIDRAYERDPVSSAAEYGSMFRSDIDGFIDLETVESAVVRDLRVIPYDENYHYRAFTDVSGGRRDSWTMAIAHSDENGVVIIDCIVEHKPPFSPEYVVENLCKVLKEYHITVVTGDKYGAQFPVELFNKHDIGYQASALSRSELYIEFLPLLASGRIQLLDHPKLIAQLTQLERRTARSGKDSVDHPPGGSDDISNSVAGVVMLSKSTLSAGEPHLFGTSPFADPFLYVI